MFVVQVANEEVLRGQGEHWKSGEVKGQETRGQQTQRPGPWETEKGHERSSVPKEGKLRIMETK